MSTINVLSKNKKNIIFFSSEMFETEQKICILHGRDFVAVLVTLMYDVAKVRQTVTRGVKQFIKLYKT